MTKDMIVAGKTSRFCQRGYARRLRGFYGPVSAMLCRAGRFYHFRRDDHFRRDERTKYLDCSSI